MHAQGAISSTTCPLAGPLRSGTVGDGARRCSSPAREARRPRCAGLVAATGPTCWSWPSRRAAPTHSSGSRRAPPSRNRRCTRRRSPPGSAPSAPAAIAMAGHSLGELPALAAAGAVDVADGLRLAVERGRIMQRAAGECGPGRNAGALGDEAEARAMAPQSSGSRSPTTTPPASSSSPVPPPARSSPRRPPAKRAAEDDEAADRGRLPFPGDARRGAGVPRGARPHRVHGRPPFRSSPAPRPSRSRTCARTLAEALVNPVRWTETLEALEAAGAGRFLEPGPGKVLTGLVRRTPARRRGGRAGGRRWMS